jgi:hypothetical protein
MAEADEKTVKTDGKRGGGCNEEPTYGNNFVS